MGYHYPLSGFTPPPGCLRIASPPDFYFNTIILSWTPIPEASHYLLEYEIDEEISTLELSDNWLWLRMFDYAGWGAYVDLGAIPYRVSALDASGAVIDGPTEWATCTCY